MNAPHQPSQQTVVENLNSTSLSRNILALFAKAKQRPEPGLALVALILWVKDNPQGRDPAWVEAVADAAIQAEADDPEATYQNLAHPDLESAQSLEEAVPLVMSLAREFVTPPAE